MEAEAAEVEDSRSQTDPHLATGEEVEVEVEVTSR
jgi:hypothetical protein